MSARRNDATRRAVAASLVTIALAAAVTVLPGTATAAEPAAGIAAAILGDIASPARRLIAVVCYLTGLVLVVRSGFRLLRRAQDRFGPPMPGTVLMLIAGTALVNLPGWLDTLGATLFGAARASRLVLSIAPDPGTTALFDALIMLLFLLGLVAAARGIALLPAAADGRATPMQAICHLIGGIALCNFPALIGAVEAAIGLDLFRH